MESATVRLSCGRSYHSYCTVSLLPENGSGVFLPWLNSKLNYKSGQIQRFTRLCLPS
jgi:hypothetical protein